MKKTNKTSKQKQFKPDYTLDFSKIENYEDLVISLVSERVKAGKTIDISDLLAYANALAKYWSSFYPVKVVCLNCTEKKTPWYKKPWEKVKKLFKK